MLLKTKGCLKALGLALLLCFSLSSAQARTQVELLPTPNQVQGPYFLPNSPKTKNLIPQGATGISLEVRGKVLDTAGAPIKDAVIHVWLADPRGIYDNQDKQGRPLKLPPNQQKLRGQVSTDAQGDYSFRSLRPGNYPLGNGQMRPAHIHILIEAPGYKTLITQLYFADDPFNQKDLPGPGFFQPELVIQLKTAAPGAAVNLEGEFHFVLETN